jgi:mRNA-degrading endonuclease RelE of RelBE toxin-antitoxin system
LKYTVLLSRQAERFYKKLQGKAKTQIRESLLDLENQGYSGKRLHGNLKDRYSIRVGKLRIVYRVLEKDKRVYITAIGPRETIYQ